MLFIMTMLTVYVCFKLGVMVGKTEERERREYEKSPISWYRERDDYHERGRGR
jgi:hypothetical protein